MENLSKKTSGISSICSDIGIGTCLIQAFHSISERHEVGMKTVPIQVCRLSSSNSHPMYASQYVQGKKKLIVSQIHNTSMVFWMRDNGQMSVIRILQGNVIVPILSLFSTCTTYTEFVKCQISCKRLKCISFVSCWQIPFWFIPNNCEPWKSFRCVTKTFYEFFILIIHWWFPIKSTVLIDHDTHFPNSSFKEFKWFNLVLEISFRSTVPRSLSNPTASKIFRWSSTPHWAKKRCSRWSGRRINRYQS